MTKIPLLMTASVSTRGMKGAAVVAKDVPPWTVAVGNPAKLVKERKINA